MAEIFSEEWALEDEQVYEFKCTNCGCTGIYFPDSEAAKRILETGTGLGKTSKCIKGTTYCMCHASLGENPHKMLMRETTLKECEDRARINV